MSDDIKISKFLIFISLLGMGSLFLEYSLYQTKIVDMVIRIIDYLIFFLFLGELVIKYKKAAYRDIFFKEKIIEILFVVFFFCLVLYNQYYLFIGQGQLQNLSKKIILLLIGFVILKAFTRIKKLNYFLQRLTVHPAQTILLSFLIVIFSGTILLMLPFSTADHSKLGFITSLFTATSATCVTGLIVVDTATRFSIYGKLIVLGLIQIGGLGIMVLSAFAGFILGKKVSLQEKLNVSYMLNEKDINNLSGFVKKIIMLTFLIEAAGTVLLYLRFQHLTETPESALLLSVFHSVSAFCNAGFALFSTSLEGFKSDPLIILTIAGLIILGGLSFAVLINSYQYLKTLLMNKVLKRSTLMKKLSTNTKVVFLISSILIVTGTLVIYKCEHASTLLPYDIGTQYLSAFFQAVTLRTAGFNSIDFAHLNRYTYLFMLLFMFVGGASGSTAGGIKVNTVGVLYAYMRGLLKNQEKSTIMKQTISKNTVNQAFFVIILALSTVFAGFFILSITEDAPLIQLLFETVSAFGTVGLSTGITANLSALGKWVIIGLMFIGRIGPVTVIAAFATRRKKAEIRYPQARINIG